MSYVLMSFGQTSVNRIKLINARSKRIIPKQGSITNVNRHRRVHAEILIYLSAANDLDFRSPLNENNPNCFDGASFKRKAEDKKQTTVNFILTYQQSVRKTIPNDENIVQSIDRIHQGRSQDFLRGEGQIIIFLYAIRI